MITICCEVSYLYIGLLTQLFYLIYAGFLNTIQTDMFWGIKKIALMVDVGSLEQAYVLTYADTLTFTSIFTI